MKQIDSRRNLLGRIGKAFLTTLLFTSANQIASAADAPQSHWEWCGWGGGGYFWTASYHPTKPGVIYMGGDCAGCYKTEDDGQNWRMINNGVSNYAVYGMAVDPKTPGTVYAMPEKSALCKSTDAGEHWQSIPETEKGKLNIYSERRVSVRPLAVDPSDSSIVYAATPLGKIYKSGDGAQSWNEVFQIPAQKALSEDVLRAEFAAGGAFGGFFIPVALPATVKAEDCRGVGFSVKSDAAAPKSAVLQLWGTGEICYRSKELAKLLEKTELQDVVLSAEDFTIDQTHAKMAKDKGQSWPIQPDWKTIRRMDFGCSGIGKTVVLEFGTVYFSMAGSQKAVARDFAQDKTCISYGAINTKGPKPDGFASVSVSQKNPRLVVAASAAGVFLSKDAGKSWEALSAPKSAKYVALDPNDANIMYGAFFDDGVHKSVDGGKTWTAINDGITQDCKIREIAISPGNSNDLVCIGSTGTSWDGFVFWSDNGGQKWNTAAPLKPDRSMNPTLGVGGFSRPTNISYCPTDPKKLYFSGNWRTGFSEDGGRTWVERDRGADISCVYDIRFSKTRAYAVAMDEGIFFSEDNGRQWQNPWPSGRDRGKAEGHYWRLNLSEGSNSADRIVATCSPWSGLANFVVVSEDGAKTFKVVKEGLLTYKLTINCVWGTGYPRALAADPKDPKTLYMGMDGDPSDDKPGGGIFKSSDGGYSWKQLEHQPGSRRMFFGLAVDPTDSKRLYWAAANGKDSGMYRSNDGGDSWKLIKPMSSCFNLAVSPTGVVYCGDKDLWRSDDQGDTWKKLTNMDDGCIEGLEIDPRNEKTIWFSTVKWSGAGWGYIMKTTDGGATWQDITGNIGRKGPAVLRFNPATNELWAGGVGLFRIKQ